MGSKGHRDGGKFSGNHTTVCPVAGTVCDFAHEYEGVTKISLGIIKTNLPNIQGKYRVKITDKDGAVLLGIRDNTCHQEVWLYTKSAQATKLHIARECRNNNIAISFGDTSPPR